MALKTLGAFTAGIAAGWVARSSFGSTREALVHAIVAGSRLRDTIRRLVAEQTEWAEDMFAEGRAYYEATRERQAFDDDAPPQVTGSNSRGRAA